MDPVPESRRVLWITMSDLWLDNELTDFELDHIAQIVGDSGMSEAELDDVFALELAPVLGANHLTPAGVWDGFDKTWVCDEAEKRYRRYRRRDRLAARLGLTTYAARPDWNRVKKRVFGSNPQRS